MAQKPKPTQITLSKHSDVYSLYGTTPRSNAAQGRLGKVTINVVDRLNDIQIHALKYGLKDKQGPFSHFETITYNIKEVQSERLVSLITTSIPRSVSFQDVNLTDRHGCINVHISARPGAEVITETSMQLDADFDKHTPELHGPYFLGTTLLEIRSPRNLNSFMARLDTLIKDMQTILTNVGPNLNDVKMTLDCPRYVQAILETLGRIGNLKALELVCPQGFHGHSEGCFDFQSAILRGFNTFGHLPKLAIPGAFLSRELYSLYLGLGSLNDLQSLTVTGTAPTWYMKTPSR